MDFSCFTNIKYDEFIFPELVIHQKTNAVIAKTVVKGTFVTRSPGDAKDAQVPNNAVIF